jgi:hypothetical protein
MVALMRSEARTPEELDALLEDAFVTHDSDAVAGLFEDGDSPHELPSMPPILRGGVGCGDRVDLPAHRLRWGSVRPWKVAPVDVGLKLWNGVEAAVGVMAESWWC